MIENSTHDFYSHSSLAAILLAVINMSDLPQE